MRAAKISLCKSLHTPLLCTAAIVAWPDPRRHSLGAPAPAEPFTLTQYRPR